MDLLRYYYVVWERCRTINSTFILFNFFIRNTCHAKWQIKYTSEQPHSLIYTKSSDMCDAKTNAVLSTWVKSCAQAQAVSHSSTNSVVLANVTVCRCHVSRNVSQCFVKKWFTVRVPHRGVNAFLEMRVDMCTWHITNHITWNMVLVDSIIVCLIWWYYMSWGWGLDGRVLSITCIHKW